MNDLLFEVPESKSPRLLWVEKHGFLTDHFPGHPETPWIAIKPLAAHKGMQIAEIMAEACRIYDDAEIIGEGQTEAEAVEDCARRLKIPLWNEEAAS